MTRIPKRKAQEMGLLPKTEKSKYNARKAVVDGITFHSQKEARQYSELKLLQRAGEIRDIKLQPQFTLQPGFRDADGEWVKPIKYIADFLVTYSDGRQEVLDSKGFRTKEYAIKRKMFLYTHGGMKFREI